MKISDAVDNNLSWLRGIFSKTDKKKEYVQGVTRIRKEDADRGGIRGGMAPSGWSRGGQDRNRQGNKGKAMGNPWKDRSAECAERGIRWASQTVKKKKERSAKCEWCA